MAANNTLATMQAYTKNVYGQVKDLIPNTVNFIREAEFSQRKKIGRNFNEPIWLVQESGYTFSAAGTDMTTLNGSAAAEAPEATASGAEIMLQTRASYKSLHSAVERGEASFGSFMGQIQMNMKKSISNLVELTMVNGNRNIGIVGSTVDGGTDVATLVLTAASWIPGAFLGRKNMKIDVYDTTLATKRNATTDIVVTSVTPTLTGPSIAVSGLEIELDAIVATDVVYMKGALNAIPSGLTEIAGLASGDTYLGIDVDDYPDLWSGNTKAVGGGITFSTIQAGLTEAAMRGGGGDHIMYLAPTKWADLADDFDAFRSTDQSYDPAKGELGQRKLTFHSTTGEVTLMPSLFVRQSEAVVFPRGAFTRMGTTDVTFDEASRGEREFHMLEGTAAYEMRAYTDQFLWGTELPSCVLFTGIT